MTPKKILLLCTEDAGGAGIATLKLLTGFLRIGVIAKMIVIRKVTSNVDVIQFNPYFKRNRISNRILRRLKRIFNLTSFIKTDPKYYFYNFSEKRNYISPEKILAHLDYKPDIIISTWTADFLNFETLKKLSDLTGANIFIWILDMGPMTGGCHYAWDCDGYFHNCANCPAIQNVNQKNVAANNLGEKKKWILASSIKAFGSSRFTLNQLSRSALFKENHLSEFFSGLIDQSIFNDSKREEAKKCLGIPTQKKVIFAGAINASEERKGLAQLKSALALLEKTMNQKQIENTLILIIGSSPPEMNILFEIINIPFLHEESLFSLYYQASDVFVCPSVQDSGPQMTLQALACGTPVVTFDIGFGFDIVETGLNGYCAPVYNVEQLAIGIRQMLELTPEQFNKVSNNAVATISALASESRLSAFLESLSKV